MLGPMNASYASEYSSAGACNTILVGFLQADRTDSIFFLNLNITAKTARKFHLGVHNPGMAYGNDLGTYSRGMR